MVINQSFDSAIVDNIDSIIDHFGLSLDQIHNYYLGTCPIHKGDNPTAFNWYTSGNNVVGNWRCNTKGCHHVFGEFAINLIQALLSVQKGWCTKGDPIVSEPEAIAWCESFLGTEYTPTEFGKSNISRVINSIYKKQHASFYKTWITDQQYLSLGIKPDTYFLQRNYKPETLNEFGVGYIDDMSNPLRYRSLVPLHNTVGSKIIGISGRSIFNKCEICKCYHHEQSACPIKSKFHLYSKWKHSSGFPGGEELYNFHRAIKHVQNSKLVLITEGPPNVWRLKEAGFPMSIASFGAKFSLSQKKRLDLLGANTIIIVPDSDSASKGFVNNIIEHCKYAYNIVTVHPSYEDDIGKCNIETVQEILLPFINKYKEK